MSIVRNFKGSSSQIVFSLLFPRGRAFSEGSCSGHKASLDVDDKPVAGSRGSSGNEKGGADQEAVNAAKCPSTPLCKSLLGAAWGQVTRNHAHPPPCRSCPPVTDIALHQTLLHKSKRGPAATRRATSQGNWAVPSRHHQQSPFALQSGPTTFWPQPLQCPPPHMMAGLASPWRC